MADGSIPLFDDRAKSNVNATLLWHAHPARVLAGGTPVPHLRLRLVEIDDVDPGGEAFVVAVSD